MKRNQTLAGRRVLVTGASGFLGSNLCDRLQASGADVHGVSRFARAAADGMRWWRSDFGDPQEIERILRAVRPDVVYHFGGFVKSLWDVGQVLPTFDSLLASTVQLLVHATELGSCRVVLASAYTDPLDNSAAPVTPYAAAKWCMTAYARMFHELYQTHVVVTRPFMTYGPHEQPFKMIPSVVTSLLDGRAPRLTNGSLAADWIYIDDVADGLLLAATAPAAVGAEIDLGTGNLTTVREVVGMILGIMQPSVQAEFGALPDRPREQVRAADVERTAALIGWRAQTSLAAGLEKTIAWHRSRSLPSGGEKPVRRA
jgi:nucleoside-diphosphate-sugar epimerase